MVITPGVSREMTRPEFWLRRTGQAGDVIMSLAQIRQFNREVGKRVNTVYNLEDYKDCLNKTELAGYLNTCQVPEKTRYDADGEAITGDFYNSVRENLNITGIKDKNPVSWGITIKKTSLRSFPTTEGVFDIPGSTEIDRFQETGVQACEAVLILHRSKDRRWYFGQTCNYRGWVRADDIALAKDKSELFAYLNSTRFLVITGNWVKTEVEPDGEEIPREFDMGTHLPLSATSLPAGPGSPLPQGNYTVKLPVRGRDNRLEFKEAVISGTGDVSPGHLPYTRENIIRQAFKLQGDRYRWGDKLKGRDCSSFLQVVFKTFGFNLPRNADQQEKGPGRVIRFKEGDPTRQRNALLAQVKPGAAVFMPGHVMLYLGRVNDTHYLIHNFAGYGKKAGSSYTFMPVYQVVVTTTRLPLPSGIPLVQKFTSAIQFELS